MKEAVSIRSERPEDAPAVARLLRAAFAEDPHSDGRESELVEALRRSDDYLPRLALTAENETGVAGFLMMTRGFVPGEGGEALPILILAPLAVTPEAQGRGIGSALVAEALLRARASGEAGGRASRRPRLLRALRLQARGGLRPAFSLRRARAVLPRAPALARLRAVRSGRREVFRRLRTEFLSAAPSRARSAGRGRVAQLRVFARFATIG